MPAEDARRLSREGVGKEGIRAQKSGLGSRLLAAGLAAPGHAETGIIATNVVLGPPAAFSGPSAAPFHMEGGKGTTNRVVRFELRPDPLAK